VSRAATARPLMARSKHTDPSRLRAARRVAAPRDGRGVGDLAARRRAAQPHEIDVASGRPRPPASPPAMRIVARRLPPGFFHPASRADVLAVLDAVGAMAVYGLRSIELARPASASAVSAAGGALRFGLYQAPGRIVLLAQPLPPWRLSGTLPAAARLRLENAGARVSRLAGGAACEVDWPPDALRRFMLDEVLLHELGHHVLQRDKGKRLARIARTADHEAFARQFASRWRAELAARR
jgi:hypothetical protein